MGVSIHAYSNVICHKEGPYTDEDENYFYDKGYSFFHPNISFPDHADGLPTGWYSYDDHMEIMHIGYGGYSAWREWLCHSVHNVMPKYLWAHLEDYEDSDFFRLIHFSDCEGILGPQTCKELLHDFWVNQLRLKLYEQNVYATFINEWMQGLKLAANGGLVKFA